MRSTHSAGAKTGRSEVGAGSRVVARLVPLALAAALLACPRSAGAVIGGQATGMGSHRAVAHLHSDATGVSGANGTGVLITPRWILTSRHLFVGGTGDCVPFDFDLPQRTLGPDLRVEVRFHPGPDPQQVVPADVGQLLYREARRADVFLFQNDESPVDFCDYDSMASDLALVRLNRRVPSTVALPSLPPLLGQPACPASGFTGTLVGYGSTTLFSELFPELCPYPTRNAGFDPGFVHQSRGPVANYVKDTWLTGSPFPLPTPLSFYVVPDPDALLDGMIMRGDSGGPLYQPVPGSPLCGVASGTLLLTEFSWVPTPICPPCVAPWWDFSVRQVHAALNAPLTQQFLESHVVVGDRFDAHCAENPLFDTDSEPQPDGWPDICDNCPQISNPDQADWDEDGFGDACDLCPGEDDSIDEDGDGCADCIERCPDEPGLGFGACFGIDMCGDADGDGVCNSDDNCPCQKNSGQDNCNVDSEIAQGMVTAGVDRLGDACDPVPCPSVAIKTLTQGSWKGPYCEETYQNQFDVRPLASHPAPTVLATSCPVPQVRTLARWCQEQPQAGIDCSDPLNISEEHLDFSTCWSSTADPATCHNNVQVTVTTPVGEEDYHFYHRITFGPNFAQITAGNGANPDGLPIELDYDRSAGDTSVNALRRWQWEFDEDFDRWTAHDMFELPLSDVESLNGTLWLHAATDVGDTSDYCATGYHGPELSNHHVHHLEPFRDRCGGWSGIRELHWPFFLFLTLPDPGPEDYLRRDASRGEVSYVVSLDGGEWGAIRLDGKTAEIVTDRMGPNLRSLALDSSLVWANAVEPYLHLGPSLEFPTAVAIEAEGGATIVDTVRWDGQQLMATGDGDPCGGGFIYCPDCPSGRCSAPGVCCEVPCTADEDCSSGVCAHDVGTCSWHPVIGSPHARDFVPVLTRVGRGLFIVGGDDVDSGEPTGEIWFAKIGAPAWRLLPSEIMVENALAATYSFLTDELVVLDEISTGEARLWAVDMASGEGRMLGSWPRHPNWDRQWLLLDRDGALLLASSTDSKKKQHAIARIHLGAAGEQPLVEGIVRGHRALALPPIADGAGYTLLLQQDQGNGKVRRQRSYSLELEPGTMVDIGAQL